MPAQQLNRPLTRPFTILSQTKDMHLLLNLSRRLALVSAFATLLSACGSPLTRTGDQGMGAVPKFPALTTALDGGTFPNIDNLRTMAPGINKAQTAALLGPPHFGEGIFGVREWDYAFNFRLNTAAKPLTCQFKVVFDDNSIARSFHWLPANCSAILRGQPAVAAPALVARPAQPPVSLTLQLRANSMFEFGSSEITLSKTESLQELSKLTAKLVELHKNSFSYRLEVVGHTDDIGSKENNDELSQRRAQAVKDYLVAAGLPSSSIEAKSFGELSPIVVCDSSMKPADRIKCLAPNRRVDVTVVYLSR